jgi:hypothetical protein
VRWALLVLAGVVVSWLAVRYRAPLGTAAAPFLGSYRLLVRPVTALAPAVGAGLLVAVARGYLDRAGWWVVQLVGYCTALAWALSLALVDGWGGLTRALLSDDSYLTDVADVGDDPLGYLASFTDRPAEHSNATRGHPPGPVLLLWALHRLGVTSHPGLGLLVTAIGAAAVPLVLSAVRSVCGEAAARKYLPVLALAPYAIWLAVSVDAVVATLGAAMVVAGVRASDRTRSGPRAAGWAALSGALLGLAALLSYAAAWLGLSVVCLYFARRRPFLNLATGLGALVPVLAADLAGFGWVDGLLTARDDYAARIEPHRSVLWWSGLSLVVLLLAAGPPLMASLRKLRNTPGWPFLVGAGAAVAFSLVAGLARGGVEHAWLPFFPWLTVAAVAPEQQAGPPPPAPLLLAGAGAVVAIALAAVLATPW